MKKTILKTGPFLVFFSVFQAQGQSSLWLQPKGEAPKEYHFDSFRSVAIRNGQLQVNSSNGTIETFDVRKTRKLFFTKNEDPTGLSFSQISSFPTKIYPNPIIGNAVTIHYDLMSPGSVAISLLSMDGSIHKEVIAQGQIGSNVFHWEVKDLPAGIYLYQIKTGDKIATGKLIR